VKVRAVLAAIALVLVATPAHAATDPRQVRATLTVVARGLSSPIAFATIPGDDSRMFVVERPGRIRVIRNGVLRATPFLDIHTRVNTAGEGGMLSLAFRPDYTRTGLFFVSWTDSDMTLHVTRFHATPTADVASASGVDVIRVPHPGATNHNAGQLAFGPGGYFFIGTGDGGGGGDPNGNAQNLRSLLGKVLRVNVYQGSPGLGYSIPPGNPFGSSTTARHEIWLYGLRNPWRFSFDRGNSNLWIGDVGQGDREEVDRVSAGGLNMGWDCREGTLNTSTQYGSGCASSGFTAPIWEYTHDYGCAIIGGYTYRGTRYASLLGGSYLFGDYCSGRLWALGPDANGQLVAGQLGTFGGNMIAFGRDNANELYLLGENGSVYRIGATHR
jgi:glucose/arabinose dehydrogenase